MQQIEKRTNLRSSAAIPLRIRAPSADEASTSSQHLEKSDLNINKIGSTGNCKQQSYFFPKNGKIWNEEGHREQRSLGKESKSLNKSSKASKKEGKSENCSTRHSMHIKEIEYVCKSSSDLKLSSIRQSSKNSQKSGQCQEKNKGEQSQQQVISYGKIILNKAFNPQNSNNDHSYINALYNKGELKFTPKYVKSDLQVINQKCKTLGDQQEEEDLCEQEYNQKYLKLTEENNKNEDSSEIKSKVEGHLLRTKQGSKMKIQREAGRVQRNIKGTAQLKNILETMKMKEKQEGNQQKTQLSNNMGKTQQKCKSEIIEEMQQVEMKATLQEKDLKNYEQNELILILDHTAKQQSTKQSSWNKQIHQIADNEQIHNSTQNKLTSFNLNPNALNKIVSSQQSALNEQNLQIKSDQLSIIREGKKQRNLSEGQSVSKKKLLIKTINPYKQVEKKECANFDILSASTNLSAVLNSSNKNNKQAFDVPRSLKSPSPFIAPDTRRVDADNDLDPHKHFWTIQQKEIPLVSEQKQSVDWAEVTSPREGGGSSIRNRLILRPTKVSSVEKRILGNGLSNERKNNTNTSTSAQSHRLTQLQYTHAQNSPTKNQQTCFRKNQDLSHNSQIKGNHCDFQDVNSPLKQQKSSIKGEKSVFFSAPSADYLQGEKQTNKGEGWNSDKSRAQSIKENIVTCWNSHDKKNQIQKQKCMSNQDEQATLNAHNEQQQYQQGDSLLELAQHLNQLRLCNQIEKMDTNFAQLNQKFDILLPQQQMPNLLLDNIESFHFDKGDQDERNPCKENNNNLTNQQTLQGGRGQPKVNKPQHQGNNSQRPHSSNKNKVSTSSSAADLFSKAIDRSCNEDADFSKIFKHDQFSQIVPISQCSFLSDCGNILDIDSGYPQMFRKSQIGLQNRIIGNQQSDDIVNESLEVNKPILIEDDSNQSSFYKQENLQLPSASSQLFLKGVFKTRTSSRENMKSYSVYQPSNQQLVEEFPKIRHCVENHPQIQESKDVLKDRTKQNYQNIQQSSLCMPPIPTSNSFHVQTKNQLARISSNGGAQKDFQNEVSKQVYQIPSQFQENQVQRFDNNGNLKGEYGNIALNLISQREPMLQKQIPFITLNGGNHLNMQQKLKIKSRYTPIQANKSESSFSQGLISHQSQIS